MWSGNWREHLWSALDRTWDVIIIGGGITGAGLLRAARRAGLEALLVEGRDFSFGTSSRSSKLVHGGLRYLRNAQFDVVSESVKERQRLLKEAPHLVTPLQFIFPTYTSDRFAGWKMRAGIFIYDLMAPKWNHRCYARRKLLTLCPQLNPNGLIDGHSYGDAAVDDSRMVLRLLREAVQDGAVAINYAAVTGLLRMSSGRVCGVVLQDRSPTGDSRTLEIAARLVINASGPWTDEIRQHVNAPPRLRKQRGSHLVFPQQRLPLKDAVTLIHPKDQRALFIIPWEGVTLIGTTDIDHTPQPGKEEPVISAEEFDYLLEAGRALFPGLELAPQDVIATFAGVRPIIPGGVAHPSKESRRHAVWLEEGLLTITGGKLTIFRRMALQTLQAASVLLGRDLNLDTHLSFFSPLPPKPHGLTLDDTLWLHLAGRYAAEALDILEHCPKDELTAIEPLAHLWAELRWAARCEGVIHLDDLLLRRVRLGLLMPQGGQGYMPAIRAICQAELGWDDTRWQQEEERYRHIWQAHYSPGAAA